MMQKEFEQIAGYEVSYEDYTNIIEPMYMATKLSKQDFVKVIDRKRFEKPSKDQVNRKLVKDMKKVAKELFETWGHSSNWQKQTELEELARSYAKLNYDFEHDLNVWYMVEYEYEVPGTFRGCRTPKAVSFGRGYNTYKRIVLVKELN